MTCCTKPDLKSSTYADWCDNCGWSYSYITNEETGDWNAIPEDTEIEDEYS